MNMSKSRGIQAKMPSPKVIYASNESKSVLARNLEECRDNDKNSQSVILSFKCILARNYEVTEQLQTKNNNFVRKKWRGNGNHKSSKTGLRLSTVRRRG